MCSPLLILHGCSEIWACCWKTRGRPVILVSPATSEQLQCCSCAAPLLGLQHWLFSLKCSPWISCNYMTILLALHLVFISSVSHDVDKSTYWPSSLSLPGCLTGHVAVFWHQEHNFFFPPTLTWLQHKSIKSQHELNHFKSMLSQFGNVHAKVCVDNNLVKSIEKSMLGLISVSLTSFPPGHLPAV